MRVSDYIAKFISDVICIKDVFILTGAGSMHLTDGVASNKKLRAICVHHEQSASMALEAYSRANENFGVGYFSTGPAALNALTGLGGAWQDSVPCMFISGQVKRSETSYLAHVDGLRQFGVQELNIIPVVSSLSKYTVFLDDPKMVRYELEKAYFIAKSGRPGPVWIEVPMDVQAAMVDEDKLVSFHPPVSTPVASQAEIDLFQRLFSSSSRPVIIAGRGVRLSGSMHDLVEFATKYNVPIVTPYLGIDNLRHDQSVYIGKTGVKGDRAANYAMQNSDLIIALGSSLHVSVIGYDYKQFARAAKKIVVDIDLSSHRKKTINFDLMIETDCKKFLTLAKSAVQDLPNKNQNERRTWLEKCCEWKDRYKVCLPEYALLEDKINIYTFVDVLSELSRAGDFFVSDAGSAFYAVSQGLQLTKNNQRYIPSSAMATMGYSLPAAIGVSVAIGNGRVLAITGDGSLQQNLQELQSVLEYDLPIKLFVLNNNGYLSIRASQKNYFNERYIGEGPRSGVSLPDTLKICDAYGIKSARVSRVSNLRQAIDEALNYDGPYVLDIITPESQAIIPTVSSVVNSDGTMSSRPLEDMAPFLERDEHSRNMIVGE